MCIFRATSATLKSLDLSYNALTRLPLSALACLNNLNWLNMHGYYRIKKHSWSQNNVFIGLVFCAKTGQNPILTYISPLVLCRVFQKRDLRVGGDSVHQPDLHFEHLLCRFQRHPRDPGEVLQLFQQAVLAQPGQQSHPEPTHRIPSTIPSHLEHSKQPHLEIPHGGCRRLTNPHLVQHEGKLHREYTYKSIQVSRMANCLESNPIYCLNDLQKW